MRRRQTPDRPLRTGDVRRRSGSALQRRHRRRALRQLKAGIRWPVAIRLGRLRRELTPLDAWGQVRETALLFGRGLVMSTSFGIQSAVLLDLVSRTAPGTPVIWVDTGYLPAETYCYAKTLTRRLDLNLHVYQSEISPARMEALSGRLWEGDRDQVREYNRIRKVEPMKRAFDDLGASCWMAGIRAEQTRHRGGLQTVEAQMGVYKLHPILRWTAEHIETYFRVYDLPRHPLSAKGYASVGDVHSSSPAAGRSRFRGLIEECGLHDAE